MYSTYLESFKMCRPAGKDLSEKWPLTSAESSLLAKAVSLFSFWAQIMHILLAKSLGWRAFPSSEDFCSSWAVHWPHMVLHAGSHSQHNLIFLLLSHVRRALALGADQTLSQLVQTQKSVLWRCTGRQRSPGRTYTTQEERSGSLSQLLNDSHTSAQN